MNKYAVKIDDEKNAKALGLALPISTKQSILICDHIRGKSVEKAVKILEDVIAEKAAIPYKRFNRDTPHRKGMGPGRYPVKASKEILKMINSAVSNAQYKGMSVSNLYIKHICAHLASRPWHYGRKTRRKAKRTHIEVVLEEREAKKRIPKKKKVVEKKEAPVKEAEPAKPKPKAEPKPKPEPAKKPEVKKDDTKKQSPEKKVEESK